MTLNKDANYRYFIIVLLACSAFFIILVSIGKPNLADDSYIFLRIARNIVSGHHYVFNTGISVEGSTSLLWTMLLTGCAAIGIPLESAARLLGIAMGIFVLMSLWYRFRNEKYAITTTLLLLLLLIVNQGYRISISKGMETGLYSLLLLLLLYTQLRESSAFESGILGVLLFMTRPESMLTLVMLGGWMFWTIYSSSQRSITMKKYIVIILIWLLGIFAVTLWRWFTFGALMPNSVLAKSPSIQLFSNPSFLVIRVGSGVLYIWGWIKQSWLIIFSASIGVIFLFKRNKYHVGLFLSLIFPSLVVVLVSGGDWMSHHRLLTPVLPIILLLGGETVKYVHDKFREIHLLSWEMGGSFLLCFASLITLPIEVQETQAGADFLNCYEEVGQAISKSLPPNSTIAPEGIGKISYILPEYVIFDFLGLVDPYIAKNGTIPTPNFTYGKVDYQHMVDIQPEVFIFHSPHFFEPISDLGYEEQYETYQIKTQPCDFLWIGLHKDVVIKTKPALATMFVIERYNIQ